MLKMGSKYIQCPLKENFFSQLGKRHSSEIRRAIHRAWGLSSKEIYPILRTRLRKYGQLKSENIPCDDWFKAFQFADNWNRYDGFKEDKQHMSAMLKAGNWRVNSFQIVIDIPTWLTLASLSFEQDPEKESPNHFFLKELFRLYVHKHYKHLTIKDEVVLSLFGEKVRIDLATYDFHDKNDMPDELSNIALIGLIGEVGGVQLWKVCALLHKGHNVIVLPHWTNQKTNPFIRKRLNYDAFYFAQNIKKSCGNMSTP